MSVSEPGTVDVEDLLSRVDVDAAADESTIVLTASKGLDEALGRLNPADGVMVQFVWVDFGPTRTGRLIIAAHHLIVDGVSWRIIVPDLVSAAAQMAGASGERRGMLLSSRPVRRCDRWAHALSEEAHRDSRVAELDTWRKVLQTPDPVLGKRAYDSGRRRLRQRFQRISVTVPTQVTETLLTHAAGGFQRRRQRRPARWTGTRADRVASPSRNRLDVCLAATRGPRSRRSRDSWRGSVKDRWLVHRCLPDQSRSFRGRSG